MTNGTYAKREGIKFTYVCKVEKLTLSQEDVAHLENVQSVHVIVILNVSPVALVDLADEARQLGLVH